MKAASQLVVHSATRHLFESCCEYVSELVARVGTIHVGTDALVRPAERRSACALKDEQVKNRRVGKFRRAAKPAIGVVKHLQSGFNDLVTNLRRKIAAFTRK